MALETWFVLIPYELIIQSAGVGIYGVDLKGNATFVNRAAAYMLGWKRAELLGRHMHRVIHHTKADGSPYPEENADLRCPSRR